MSFPLTTARLIDETLGEPYYFDYTDTVFATLPVRDIAFMQHWNERTLLENGKKWGIAGYLEDRTLRLSGTHLVEEGRIYHLGIDVIASAGTMIYSPYAGCVIESAVEMGSAGYGGYVIVEYCFEHDSIFVLFGHLNPSNLHNLGRMNPGECIGEIGASDVNGGWTTHLHVQAFSGLDFQSWKMKGYCSRDDLVNISSICPDPSFLLRH